jgi:hypothetical protein
MVQTTQHSVTKRPLEQSLFESVKEGCAQIIALVDRPRFARGLDHRERAIARAAMGALDQPTALALCHRVTCFVSTPSLLSSKANLRKLILQLGARWLAPEMSGLEQRSYEEARRWATRGAPYTRVHLRWWMEGRDHLRRAWLESTWVLFRQGAAATVCVMPGCSSLAKRRGCRRCPLMSELRDCAGHSHYQLPLLRVHIFGAA